MRSPQAEMHAAVHDLLAERAQLRARIHELTVELEVAQQMIRQQNRVAS